MCEGLFAWWFAKSMQNRCFQKCTNKYIPNLYSGANNLNRKSISVQIFKQISFVSTIGHWALGQSDLLCFVCPAGLAALLQIQAWERTISGQQPSAQLQ